MRLDSTRRSSRRSAIATIGSRVRFDLEARSERTGYLHAWRIATTSVAIDSGSLGSRRSSQSGSSGSAAPIGAQSLDEDVFAAQVPPNVVLFVDNSGSMDNVIEHSSYDSATAVRTCDPFTENGNATTINNSIANFGYHFWYIKDDNNDDILAYCWAANAASCYLNPDVYYHSSDYVYSSNTNDHPGHGLRRGASSAATKSRSGTMAKPRTTVASPTIPDSTRAGSSVRTRATIRRSWVPPAAR